MRKYQNILVTLDLSPEDDDPVVERAREFSESLGAKVSLLHVVEPFYNYVSPYVVEAVSEWQEQTLRAAKEKVAEWGGKLHLPKKQQIVTVGSVQAEIHRVATEIKADLILVGSHGRHGLSLFLHGSTASDVVHHASCDVLAVNVQRALSESS